MQTPIPPGTIEADVTLVFPAIPEDRTGQTYARFRLSTDPAAAAATDLESLDAAHGFVYGGGFYQNWGGRQEKLRDDKRRVDRDRKLVRSIGYDTREFSVSSLDHLRNRKVRRAGVRNKRRHSCLG